VVDACCRCGSGFGGGYDQDSVSNSNWNCSLHDATVDVKHVKYLFVNKAKTEVSRTTTLVTARLCQRPAYSSREFITFGFKIL